MNGEDGLRQTAGKIKSDLRGSAYDELAAIPIDQLRGDLESEIFMTSIYRKPSFAADAVNLVAELLLDAQRELRSLWGELPMSDVEDLAAFNLLLDELLLSYGSTPLTGARRFGITTVEGTIAGWASLVGARTARDPETRPLLLKIPARIRGWRLVPPDLPASVAAGRAKAMADAVSSPLVDPYLADKVFGMMAEHATTPMQPAIREILRGLSTHHIGLLTTLHRAADYLLRLSIPGRGGRRFFMTLIAHVTYRGLVIGYRHSVARSPR